VSQKGFVIKNEVTRKAHKNYLKHSQAENTWQTFRQSTL